MTISADLAIIKSQNADILAYLKAMAYQQSPTCCLPANTTMPELPAIPLLPPVVPNVPQTAIDGELCKRIQKEIDNICNTWSQLIDVGAATGTITVAAAAAIIGLALAPESGGLSAVALAGFAAGVSTLIAMAGAEVGNIPITIRQDAALAAYAARQGGSFVATNAAINVLKTDFPSPESANIFGNLVSLFGGLKRAFDDTDIGDYASYPLICVSTNLTVLFRKNGNTYNTTAVDWELHGIPGTNTVTSPPASPGSVGTYNIRIYGEGAALAGHQITISGYQIYGYSAPEVGATLVHTTTPGGSYTFTGAHAYYVVQRSSNSTPDSYTFI